LQPEIDIAVFNDSTYPMGPVCLGVSNVVGTLSLHASKRIQLVIGVARSTYSYAELSRI